MDERDTRRNTGTRLKIFGGLVVMAFAVALAVVVGNRLSDESLAVLAWGQPSPPACSSSPSPAGATSPVCSRRCRREHIPRSSWSRHRAGSSGPTPGTLSHPR